MEGRFVLVDTVGVEPIFLEFSRVLYMLNIQ